MERQKNAERKQDRAIIAALRAKLHRDAATAGAKIEVDAFRGIVHLSGNVPVETVKNRAGELAREISGVSEVKNNIIISLPVGASVRHYPLRRQRMVSTRNDFRLRPEALARSIRQGAAW